MSRVKVSFQRYSLQEVEYEVDQAVVDAALAGDEDAKQIIRDLGIDAMDEQNPEHQWSSSHWLTEDEEIDTVD